MYHVFDTSIHLEALSKKYYLVRLTSLNQNLGGVTEEFNLMEFYLHLPNVLCCSSHSSFSFSISSNLTFFCTSCLSLHFSISFLFSAIFFQKTQNKHAFIWVIMDDRSKIAYQQMHFWNSTTIWYHPCDVINVVIIAPNAKLTPKKGNKHFRRKSYCKGNYNYYLCDSEYFKNNTEFRYTELFTKHLTRPVINKVLQILQEIVHWKEPYFGKHSLLTTTYILTEYFYYDHCNHIMITEYDSVFHLRIFYTVNSTYSNLEITSVIFRISHWEGHLIYKKN